VGEGGPQARFGAQAPQRPFLSHWEFLWALGLPPAVTIDKFVGGVHQFSHACEGTLGSLTCGDAGAPTEKAEWYHRELQLMAAHIPPRNYDNVRILLSEWNKRRNDRRCVEMPEAQWKAQCRAAIAEASDVGPLMLAWVPIWAARDANVARNLVQQTQVWNEVALHNRQLPAQRRVARVVRNHFAIDSDSE